MPSRPFHYLTAFFERNRQGRSISALRSRFRLFLPEVAASGIDLKNLKQIADVYEEALLHLEGKMAASRFSPDITKQYSRLFLELENLLHREKDDRHSFVIVVPVADRPKMLENCLKSLLKQCALFKYGGTHLCKGTSTYRKISVLIVDDSEEKHNMDRNKTIARMLNESGIPARYLGIPGQSRIVNAIPESLRADLKNVLGSAINGVQPHKGASITRNVAYIYLRSYLKERPEKTLVYFMDSDEEFGVFPRNGHADPSTINYFYWLDRLFDSNEIDIVTGKVVGDPPVSPSVMASGFLDDLVLFLRQVAGHDHRHTCIFHDSTEASNFGPASYHDLVTMFGYESPPESFPYRCSITKSHNIGETFRAFSSRISGFLYGWHPTRKTVYHHNGGPLGAVQARTVYTGNYIFRPSALRFFIPYAHLNLRMAGPALGRLLRARIGPRFVSVNLPLYHKRTLTRKDRGEFRPGVLEKKTHIDLTDEAVRQFWGDVLLFSVDALTEHGYPDNSLDLHAVRTLVKETETRMWGLYVRNYQAISKKLRLLEGILNSPGYWWNHSETFADAVADYQTFLANIEFNFAPHSKGYQKIHETLRDQEYSSRIVSALTEYSKAEMSWKELLLEDPSSIEPSTVTDSDLPFVQIGP
ncbi:MAG: glycosyltransferase family A protein [Pseudomonadota bacterium]